jgi:hypothetical protein
MFRLPVKVQAQAQAPVKAPNEGVYGLAKCHYVGIVLVLTVAPKKLITLVEGDFIELPLIN